ncbi:MAG: mcrC [Firmicutes bacterium]|nr:mcrC [Bacillota bacterium]
MAEIKIQNLYYMLSYAFHALREDGITQISPEDFDHIHDLLSAILAHGISQQLRRGLHRDYVHQEQALSSLRGQLLLSESLKRQTQIRRRLVCCYDEFTEDTPHNRILKCTMALLLHQGELNPKFREALRKLLPYFTHVKDISPSLVRFDTLQYHRSNASYRLLMGVCWLVLEGLLLTTKEGTHQLVSWVQDEPMHRLYERFLLSYYQRHHSRLTPKRSYINWDLEENTASSHLPLMATDVILQNWDKILIIEAKYYSRTMAIHYDKYQYHASNLYQIYTYVKNMDRAKGGNVSGVLLYAKTEEALVPDDMFSMNGNIIRLLTLDLNCPWREITRQLDGLAATLDEPLSKP